MPTAHRRCSCWSRWIGGGSVGGGNECVSEDNGECLDPARELAVTRLSTCLLDMLKNQMTLIFGQYSRENSTNHNTTFKRLYAGASSLPVLPPKSVESSCRACLRRYEKYLQVSRIQSAKHHPARSLNAQIPLLKHGSRII